MNGNNMTVADYEEQTRMLEQDIVRLALQIQRCTELLKNRSEKLDKLIADNIPF